MKRNDYLDKLSVAASKNIKEKDFWLATLSGKIEKTIFAYDFPDIDGEKPEMATVSFQFQGEMFSYLMQLSKGSDHTLHLILLAGLSAVIFRYTGNPDIIVGATIYKPEVEKEFINTLLALKLHFEKNMTFKDLLLETKQTVIQAVANQNYPIEILAAQLGLKSSSETFPLFDIALVVENIHDKKYLCDVNLNMILSFLRTSRDIKGIVEYNARRYNISTIQRIVGHIQNFLNTVLLDVNAQIHNVDILLKAERQKLLETLNDTDTPYPKTKTIHQLFEEQVERTPNNPAVLVCHTGEKLTYSQLNQTANRVARVLREKGVGTGTIVALKLDRSSSMITGILGVLKAGGAYLPIDPGYPKARIKFILADSNTNFLLTSKLLSIDIEYDGVIINVEDYASVPYEKENLKGINNPTDLAYIIYTSGTTGQPKGVMIEHRNVVRLMYNDRFLFDFDSYDTWTMCHSYCFDFSVWEMYGALLYGARLVIIPQMVARDPALFRTVLKEQTVTILNQTPSAFYGLIQEEFQHSTAELNIKYIIFGGEALNPLKLKQWKTRYPRTRLINMFGITETTVHVTYKEIEETEIQNNKSNIGKPIPTMSTYILDSLRQLLPIGVSGELYIGGDGVSRGYLNRPQLTQQKFIRNPYRPSQLLYQSGDLAKYLDTGDMEYFGRIDHQVQLHGYRIELGEIESKLINHSNIKEAVVLVKEDKNENNCLCAYVVGSQVETNELREYLGRSLPYYMIPSYFIFIKNIPLTENGKIDYQALPKPSVTTDCEYVAPSDEKENKIVDICRSVLDLPQIGVKDNLFHIGADSIKAITLVNLINSQFDVILTIADLYTCESIEKLVHLMDTITTLTENDSLKKEVLAELDQLKETIIANHQIDSDVEDIYPMSDIEAGMLFHSLTAPTSAVYHDQFNYQRNFPRFDIKTFEKALRLMVNKHSILRSAFYIEAFGKPVQMVKKEVPIHLKHYDISNRSKVQQEKFIKEVMEKDRNSSFNVEEPPLWRMMIFNVGNDHICFLWSFHHAILDGWSNASFLTELNNLYLQLQENFSIVPPPLTCNYRDFIIDQIIEKKKGDIKDYWREELADYKRFNFPRVENQKHSDQPPTRVKYDLGVSQLEKLEEVARNFNISLKHLCFGMYIYMLNMLSYESDIVVGLVTNNRPLCEDGDKILGCFLNTIPVRIKIPSHCSWLDYFAMIEKKNMELKKYDRLSLSEILAVINEKVEFGNPIFDTIFNFVDFHIFKQLIPATNQSINNESLSLEEYENTNTLFDFTITTSGSLFIVLSYSGSLLDPDDVERLMSYYKGLINIIHAAPQNLMQKEDLLQTWEKQALLFEFNSTHANYPAQKTIHELFEDQVEKTPDYTAVLGLGQVKGPEKSLMGVVTYTELNRRSNRLARYLNSHAVQPGPIIGIMMQRSIEMIIALFSILKAGAAYLPIDPKYPQERINYMLNDSGAKLLVTTNDQEGEKVRRWDGEKVFLENTFCKSPKDSSYLLTFLPSYPLNSSNLAYIIYTSGSTGKPKGVMIEHHSLVNRLNWMQQYYPLNESDVILQKTPIVFDVSLWELFWWSIRGASVFMLGPSLEKEPESIVEAVSKNHITTLHFVPSMLNVFLEYIENTLYMKRLTSLKQVFVSGEALNTRQVETFNNLLYKINGTKIINLYGPTEATVDVSYFNCSPTPKTNRIPIGKPIHNIQLYVVNKSMQLQPLGTPGELCIAGQGLARGYLNRPLLTQQQFTVTHFLTGERLYRTGDLARWLPDGNIEFLGRLDHQMKIRGNRVELGEIEYYLSIHPQVKEVVVTAITTNMMNDALCAYILPAKRDIHGTNDSRIQDSYLITELRDYLSQHLPDYMIPTHFVPLKSVPLTSNGKVDLKALPDIHHLTKSSSYVAPSNLIEEKITEIWAEILEIEKNKISTDENFFNLGGHSIKAISMLSRLHKVFDVKITITQLFKKTTVKALAQYLQKASKDKFIAIEPAEEREYYPLSSAQKRLYILYMMDKQSLTYNIPEIHAFEGDIDVEKIEQVYRKLILRHESFRTSFISVEDEPVQKIHPPNEIPFKVNFVEMKGDETKDISQIKQYVMEAIKPFDFSKAPLLRFTLVKVERNRFIMIIDMAHIITDGTSNRFLYNEFMAFYAGENLPPLKLQYKDYSQWQYRLMHQEKGIIKRQEAYWLKEFAGDLPVLDMPTDYPRPLLQSFDGDQKNFYLGEEKSEAMEQLSKNENVTEFILLSSIFYIFLTKVSGQEDIIVGTHEAGRRHLDLEHIVGVFVNTLAQRRFPIGDKTFREFLNEMKIKALEDFENLDYQFEDLVNRIWVNRNTSRNPIFDVSFLYEVVSENPKKMWNLKSISYSEQINYTSKFDLTLLVGRGANQSFNFEYCTRLFKSETIGRFFNIIKKIIDSVLDDPDIKISGIGILDEKEKRQLLQGFNDTIVEYSVDRTLTQLFEQQVEEKPDYMALIGSRYSMGSEKKIDEIMQLTYKELNQSSNQLAHVLIEKGVMPDVIVGIMVERSIEMIVGIISILKAGAAYLPINPKNPKDRIDYMLKDSNAKVLIINKPEIRNPKFETNPNVQNSNNQNKNFEELMVLNLDHLNFDLVSNSELRASDFSPSNLAYIIYTSGSTGTPKGVSINHANLCPLLHWGYKNLGIRPNDRTLQNLSYYFDWSVWEIFITLTIGAKLYIVSDEVLLNPADCILFMKEKDITILHVTPTQYQHIIGGDCKLETLRYLFLGAEQLTVDLLKRSFASVKEECRIFNMYGPTEATIISAVLEIKRSDKNRFENLLSVPIGRSVANGSLLILDKYLNICPVNVTGELYIGGDGVARGYLNNPELTTKRFIRNVISQLSLVIDESQRDDNSSNLTNVQCPMTNDYLYKTGDLARWLPDGNIEFLGRIDHQVKIRGFRIELGEIEYQLLKHKHIKEAVVVINEDEIKDKNLTAYIVSTEELLEIELRKYLRNKLPDYMIPSHFVRLEEIPLTPNGKLDRQALPKLELKCGESYTAPRNKIERKLVGLWANVLSIPPDVISIDRNFFELGGHSLKATVLASRIHKELNVILPLAELFKTPTIRGLSEYIRGTVEDIHESIMPVEEKEYYVLSFAQKRMYILQQIDLNNTAYNMPQIIPLPEAIDIDKLEDSFRALIKRHDSLRTSFHMIGDQPVQKIHKEVAFKIGDYNSATDERCSRQTRTFLATEVTSYEDTEIKDHHSSFIIHHFIRAFDFSKAPLLRVGMLKTAEGRNYLLVDMHHIISDGVSHEILVKDFLALNDGKELPPLRIQYKDFSQWQNSEPEKDRLRKQESYWLQELEGEIPVLELPTDYLRPLLQGFEGDTVKFEISGEETQAISALGLTEGATLFMVMTAVVNVLLSKLSGQEDIIIGTPIAGRRHVDLEMIIGMFVNTLALRNYPVGDRTFREFLGEVKERTMEVFENQEYPFEELVDKLSVKRDTSRNPVFDVMFSQHNVENFSDDLTRDESGAEEENVIQTAKFDLTLTAVVGGPLLRFGVQYCTQLFKKETIDRFIIYFKKIVSMVLTEPGIKISEIDIISEEEKKQILYDFNGTEAEYPKDKAIQQLFEEQVGKSPDCIAVFCHGRTRTNTDNNMAITYHQLNEQSDRLAGLLIEKGVLPDTIVGIMMGRSIEMVIGIMGILKSGGAYLPIDPEYPQERIDYMLKDSSAQILLTANEIASLSTGCVFNFHHSSFIVHHSSHLAYIIYTSGSTGRPKGVMIGHQNVNNLVKGLFERIYKRYTGNLKVALLAPYVFDASVKQIFGALLLGHSLHIVSEEVRLVSDDLVEFYSGKVIDITDGTPAHLRLLIEGMELKNHLPPLKHLLIGGEGLPCQLVKAFGELYEQQGRIMPVITNVYGPTECCVDTASFEVALEDVRNRDGIVFIGNPMPNQQVYILSPAFLMQPVGIPGELCIGGANVGRGYLNKPDLTAEKFRPQITLRFFKKAPLVYRTGDLARWLADGNIEFMGRIDQQVKIRGFRIELGEVESQILNHDSVKEVVVIAREDKAGFHGQHILCAYVVVEDEFDSSGLREYLSVKLPEYMIPSYFVRLEKIPLTSNGKIDRRALPQPELKAGQDYVAPRNGTEAKLVELWAAVLNIQPDVISIDRSFFELGGHSLKATVLASRIHKELNVLLPLAELFKAPTIRGLSEYIRGAMENIYESIMPVEEKEYYVLSFAQQRMYILQQIDLNSTAYNMPEIMPLPEEVDIDRLKESFEKLIKRHDSLRTSFHMIGDQPLEKIHREVDFKIEKYDESGVHQFIRAFDLSCAPLLRVGELKTVAGRNYLMVDMHHIISDGVSHHVLREEFMALYEGKELPPLRIQYKDFAQWQNSPKELERLHGQMLYWLQEFEGEIPVLEIPIDYPRPISQSFEGDSINFEMSVEDTRALNVVALKSGATLFMVLAAAVNILLSKLSGQEEIIIGTPIAGRRHSDLEKVIGMFVNTLVLRNYPIGERTFKEFLVDIKERVLMVFENQEYPFEGLVDKLALKRDMGRNPLFDVMFVLQNMNAFSTDQNDNPPSETDLSVQPDFPKEYENIAQTAKFDLTFTAMEIGRKTLYSIQYCTKLFKQETIQRFSHYFKKIVSQIIENPGLKLNEIEIILDEERRRLLVEFNNAENGYPNDKTIHGLFEEQMQRTPDNMAVVLPSVGQISYRELEKKSNGLAGLLRENGVETGTVVGIMADRSIEMIIGLLGILKSGGVYLPLNPRQPEARTQFMMEDSDAKVLLTDYEKKKMASCQLSIVNCELLTGVRSVRDTSHHSSFSIHHSNHLAYLIYTSGSTGNPKGVPITHANFSPLVHWGYRIMGISEADRFLQNLSYFFDWSAWEIFLALTTGAGLYITGEDVLLDGRALGKFIRENKITVLHITPSQFQVLVGVDADGRSVKPESLKHLCLGAEKLTYDLVKRSIEMVPANCRIYNMYGPTEATIIASVLEINRNTVDKYENLGSVPIGIPVGNTQLYVLDKYFNLCPPNVTGELYIGGEGLSKGYVNNAELTAEKFIDFHYSSFIIHHSILYRTGDMARWLPGGEVEFLGRIDYQVKIRGHRIELGEIENKCLEHEGVKVAVATVKGETDLCAYIVPEVHIADEKGFKAELKNYLAGRLPGYMVPSFIVLIKSISLTPNGKVDLRTLPQPELLSLEEYFAPRNVVEEKLVKIWADVLGKDSVKDRIGIDDNFFELGGHSLKAAIMAAKIDKEFSVRIPLVEIFKTPTIKMLAEYIKNACKVIRRIVEPDWRLVLLKEGAIEDKHLFFIHDGTGEVEGYIEFCEHLREGFNCWGIRAGRLENLAPRNVTITELAKTYIETMKKIQPQGPYYITGWSLGGTIVFEMAEQLEQTNEEIAFLALVDSPPPHKNLRKEATEFNVESELRFVKGYVAGSEMEEKLKITSDLDLFWLSIVDYLETNPHDAELIKKLIRGYGFQALSNYDQLGIKETIYYLNVARTLSSARAHYIPDGKLNTQVHYFKASQSKKTAQQHWEKYCRKPIKYSIIPGDHFSIFKMPGVVQFTDTFGKILPGFST